MKKLSLAALVAVAMTAPAAFAQTATPPAPVAQSSATFDVALTMTPVCFITGTATGTTASTTLGNINISYVPFQATNGTGSTSFYVRCSTGITYDLALDSAALTDGLTGLNYTLALKTANTGNAATAVASLSSQVGASASRYFVQAYVPSGQGGSTPGTDNKQRTLTILY